MDVGCPYLDVIPGARGKLLATLVQLEKAVTVRTLARHSGVSSQSALNLVADMGEAGIVRTERIGGVVLVSLNRDHLLVGAVTALARTRGLLIQRISAELAAWPQLVAAWLFGSAARGDGGRSSDIDLFLVTSTSIDDPAWIASVEALAEHVHAWTGNRVQAVEHSWASFVQLVHDDNVLIGALRSEGIELTPESRKRLREAA